MAEVKSVTVQYSRTYNIGNYESIRLGLELTKDIVPGENITEEVNKSMRGMQALVQKEADRIVQERSQQK